MLALIICDFVSIVDTIYGLYLAAVQFRSVNKRPTHQAKLGRLMEEMGLAQVAASI